ncbi:sigma-54 factor interaction domain-containing protein, partial [Escherichia coli]|nr:sigma-54 factor interaction domain-containing protein [Escherichia coli]
LAKRVAASDVAGVLLQGETGTGKDLFARAIHTASSRAEKPFMAINCAALPATLIESELFGYEKGAFTDAKQRKEGLFEQA